MVSVYSTATRVLWSQEFFGRRREYSVWMSYGGATTTLSSEIGRFFGEVLADDVAAYLTDAYVEKNTF